MWWFVTYRSGFAALWGDKIKEEEAAAEDVSVE
jgi:hypothetical protein